MAAADTEMEDAMAIERANLCLAGANPGVALHSCDTDFLPTLRQHYTTGETRAAEQLMRLKSELRDADTETFWTRLMEGMTEIAHAQYGFVAKRILVDDQETAVEMPAIGEDGSCLLGVAFYYNDGKENKAMHRDYKYLAWGAPCAYMKHDKVFLVPERMSEFITKNPNALPFAAEGYLAVPLFSEGKCFAHFGMMWTQEGLDQRNVSWANTEMMMHSLEDLIIARLTSGHSFTKTAAKAPQTLTPPEASAKVVPRDAITATQSLKPYAKSLSHELRTPMHGVVGMLDIMYATVQEQIEAAGSPRIRQIFQTLKENIETIQDSSKRAVEAADNVVHAYDMNMQIPDTPMQDTDSPATAVSQTNAAYFDYKPTTRVIEGNNTYNPHKRRRSTENWHFGNAMKIRHIQSARREVSPHSNSPSLNRSSSGPPPPQFDSSVRTPDADMPSYLPMPQSSEAEGLATPGSKNCFLRSLIPVIIQDALRVGGRPDSAISEPTDLGERIEVRSRSSNGEVSQKTIEWSVEAEVPVSIFIDERDLSKLISAVVLNAVKFTENGKITFVVKVSKSGKYLVFNCEDTGDGIPEDFQPELFKPFSREDDSTTRSKEGLGLGLLVAKGIARRIGGDLMLLRSEISGPNKGSQFEIRVPLEPNSSLSRAGTPLARTPEPSRSASRPGMPATTGSAQSARELKPVRKRISPPGALSPEKRALFSPAIDTPVHTASVPPRRSSVTNGTPLNSNNVYDRKLAEKYPLSFLVAEDNKINRKLLVSMLGKLGYKDVHEAFDGKEAVRIVSELYHRKRRRSDDKHTRSQSKETAGSVVDVVLMDLWMPEMDGYQATEEIFRLFGKENIHANGSRRNSGVALSAGNANGSCPINGVKMPKILAVSADATDDAIDRATKIGMEGFMTKPYKLMDLQRLITEFCIH